MSYYDEMLSKMQSLVTSDWVTLYSELTIKNELDDLSYSALISDARLPNEIDDINWGIYASDGRPGLEVSSFGKRSKWHYRNYYGSGLEPLVLKRTFDQQKKEYLEMAEDIRLYFNLWYDEKSSTYVQIQDDGSERCIVRISSEKVEINRDSLEEYLALRKMNLVLYNDFRRFDDNDKSYVPKIKKTKYLYIDYFVADYPIFSEGKAIKQIHLFKSKQIIRYKKDFDPENHEKSKKKFIEFEFKAKPENNNLTRYSCDRDGLRNNFGKNPTAAHFLTPVFFRKEVLDKYYNSPDRFIVKDGLITAKGLWLLRIDNNLDKEVCVFLGDLSYLPLSEQYYWRSFNIVSDSEISEVNFRRNFSAEFTDPSQSDLLFRQYYKNLCDIWYKQFGWRLFNDLNKGDQYHIDSIRLMQTDNQGLFDAIVLSLDKLLVDCINVESLSNLVTPTQDEKSISLLGRYLANFDLNLSNVTLVFLKNLHALRSSSSAHGKGKNYSKARKKFENSEKDGLREISAEILAQANNVLQNLINFSANFNTKKIHNGYYL